MTKYVEWVEPIDNITLHPVIQRMTVEHVIDHQKRVIAPAYQFSYASDEAALQDFIAVHWATVVEE